MVRYPGKNQQIVLDALVDSNLTLKELQDTCIPKHMDLQRFDYTVGTLIRKGAISCIKSNNEIRITKEAFTPLTPTEEYILLTLLHGGPEHSERLIAKIKRSLHVSENAVRMGLGSLKMRGYVDVVNSPKRAIHITQAGREALGDKNDIQS